MAFTTKMEKKITYSDIKDATCHELKKTYKISDRQLEQAIRRHTDGANVEERRNLYQVLYGKRK